MVVLSAESGDSGESGGSGLSGQPGGSHDAFVTVPGFKISRVMNAQVFIQTRLECGIGIVCDRDPQIYSFYGWDRDYPEVNIYYYCAIGLGSRIPNPKEKNSLGV